jgi:hypothetical protein
MEQPAHARAFEPSPRIRRGLSNRHARGQGLSPPAAGVRLTLIMHLAPTLLIGYAIVIPRSCIAGVNAETVGFAAAIAGFALAYAAGVRLARREGMPHA